jgi:hypothetical protein
VGYEKEINMQNLQGYRTFIAAFLMTVFGVLAMTDWVAFLANPKAGMVAVGSAILFAVLRIFTTTPAGVKEEEKTDK